MNVAIIIPLIGQLLALGLRIADVIERANDVSPEDKVAMKAAIKAAQESVSHLTGDEIGIVPEIVNPEVTEAGAVEYYKTALLELYSSGEMSQEEYKLNMQVFNLWVKNEFPDDRQQLQESLDRALTKYTTSTPK